MSNASEAPKLDKPCPPCKTGPGLWMATFADMAILLMAMFVLLIALAETAKQRNTMFSIPGENQSAFGTQDLVESDLAPSGYQGAEINADTNEGYEEVVKALAKEIKDGKVDVKIKDQRVVVNVDGVYINNNTLILYLYIYFSIFYFFC